MWDVLINLECEINVHTQTKWMNKDCSGEMFATMCREMWQLFLYTDSALRILFCAYGTDCTAAFSSLADNRSVSLFPYNGSVVNIIFTPLHRLKQTSPCWQRRSSVTFPAQPLCLTDQGNGRLLVGGEMKQHSVAWTPTSPDVMSLKQIQPGLFGMFWKLYWAWVLKRWNRMKLHPI